MLQLQRKFLKVNFRFLQETARDYKCQKLKLQGRNEVYGIIDQREKWGGIWDQTSRGIGISSVAGGSGIKFSDRKSNIIK